MTERSEGMAAPRAPASGTPMGGKGGAAPQQVMIDDDDESPLATLREPVENPHGFRGYGPLLALAVLVVLMVLLAPTIAPEEIVLKPTDPVETTTTVAP